MDMVPLTELDAVNVMLASIGQAPVNTLDVTGIRDVAIARTTLHNVSRAVQTKGWPFNTDPCYSLALDGNGKIDVPATAFKIDPVDPYQKFVVRRDGADSTLRLYDRENNTFDIGANHTGPIEAEIVWFFPFEDIPQYARNYIGLRAARTFQATIIGSDLLYRFTKQEEDEAYADMMKATVDQEDSNIFDAYDFASNIFHRR